MSIEDVDNELYYVNATIGNNNYSVNFILDSGTTFSTVSQSTIKKSGINTDNLIKRYASYLNSSGVTKAPIIDLTTSINGSAPMVVEYVIVTSNLDLMALSDVEKVFDISFIGGKLKLTPVARPFKKNIARIKQSRLGWDISSYMVTSADFV